MEEEEWKMTKPFLNRAIHPGEESCIDSFCQLEGRHPAHDERVRYKHGEHGGCEPGHYVVDDDGEWIKIGITCSARRRSLWVRFPTENSNDGFDLCAGREGSDACVHIRPDNPQFRWLHDVITTIVFASET
jgi:hypothetical protein